MKRAQYNILPNRWNLNYGSGQVVECEYAPGGDPSGFCLGAGVTDDVITEPGGLDDSSTLQSTDHEPNTSVTLATCGITPQTMWIIDTNNEGLVPGYIDLISAGYAVDPEFNSWLPFYTGPVSYSVSPFSVPDVLTVNSSGWRKPARGAP